MRNFLCAFALPQGVFIQAGSWECDERKIDGFALPVLYLEKPACSSMFESTAGSSNNKIFQEWNPHICAYGTVNFATGALYQYRLIVNIWFLTTTGAY